MDQNDIDHTQEKLYTEKDIEDAVKYSTQVLQNYLANTKETYVKAFHVITWRGYITTLNILTRRWFIRTFILSTIACYFTQYLLAKVPVYANYIPIAISGVTIFAYFTYRYTLGSILGQRDHAKYQQATNTEDTQNQVSVLGSSQSDQTTNVTSGEQDESNSGT